MEPSSLILTLPVWVESFVARFSEPLTTPEHRMEFVLALARENIRRKSGGPFAAAVFTIGDHALISVGVNRVAALNCSIAHAEMMAIGLAQQRFETFNLGTIGSEGCELVTSTEPCAMCLGALPWSGVRRVTCGAADADARAIGFDEGEKPAQWAESLTSRGITVVRDVCRADAAEVLREYAQNGGLIYNGRSADAPPRP